MSTNTQNNIPTQYLAVSTKPPRYEFKDGQLFDKKQVFTTRDEIFIEKLLNDQADEIIRLNKLIGKQNSKINKSNQELEKARTRIEISSEPIDNSKIEELLGKDNRQRDFDILSTLAKDFLSKYGNPHSKIIADCEGIEMVNGEIAKSFNLEN